jgi:ketosteroid isomerase-like protein
MRSLVVVLSLLVLIGGVVSFDAKADDAATIAAVNASSNALDEAFTKKDVETIKALMTPDHITVTPYYDGPQTVQDQLDTLGAYDWSQTIVGEPNVALVTPDVALRTFTADLKGTFQGKTLPARVFATELLVKRGDKWIERFYQETRLD